MTRSHPIRRRRMKGFRVVPAIYSLFILTALTSCGSSGGPTAGGGVGGTGISVGPITGFGSVFVNGVEFSTTTETSITKNGSASDENDLRVGMVVAVQGTFDANGTSGTAEKIDFNDILEGPIQTGSIQTVDQSFMVMGQPVKTDSKTQYAVVTGFDDLKDGYVIEVSGLPQSNGTLLATYIELKSTSCSPGDESEVKGTIRNLDATAKTFQIGNLMVDYSAVHPEDLPSGGLSDGMFVEVKTTACYSSGVLTASQVEVQTQEIPSTEGTRVELEGFITQFLSPANFNVNGQPVSTTGATVYEPLGKTSNDLALNVQVEVEGHLNALGVLIADKISFDD
jgi:hypothetical protein